MRFDVVDWLVFGADVSTIYFVLPSLMYSPRSRTNDRLLDLDEGSLYLSGSTHDVDVVSIGQ